MASLDLLQEVSLKIERSVIMAVEFLFKYIHSQTSTHIVGFSNIGNTNTEDNVTVYRGNMSHPPPMSRP